MIYIIEDDNHIRELVLYALSSAGFEARGFACGAEFDENADPDSAELLLLDIMLPGEDGLSILRRLRADKRTAKLPVIMLTAMGSEYDVCNGLDSGADDYISKPFGMKALLSRIRALLRRSGDEKRDGDPVLGCGGIELDTQAHTVKVDGEPVSLTVKEYELLKYLMERQGSAVQRQELLEAVWGIDGSIETRTLDVHIRTLRQKLGCCGTAVATVRGVGYRMEKP